MKGHPLEIFRYCPKCGSNDFKIHNALSRHCANCGFTYYQNPRASTAAFIINGKGELLVARRGNVYHYSGMDIHTLDFFFLCHVAEDAEVKAADDAAELTWLPLREVYVERFGLRSIREAVHRFLREKVKR